jgi:hypothetical protein
MKKKLFLSLAALVCVTVAAIITAFSVDTAFSEHSNLILQNLEALTNGETVDYPCDPSSSTCTFKIKLADGTEGPGSLNNAKNVS